MNFPEAFKTNLSQILGAELPAFLKALESPAPVSVRLNPKKKSELSALKIEGNVSWAKDGHYLQERPFFTEDPAFHAGAYGVQEASSMFLGHVFEKVVDRKRPIKVLDLCASKGVQTTILASLLGENDLLVANEIVKSQLSILKENLLKWGFSNVIVSNQDPETFADLEGFFDVVLVDAPSSGEGLFRTKNAAFSEWSEANVQMHATRQKRLLSAAAMLVAPKGVLIYTTNTYNSTENQENVKWLNRTLDFETMDLEMPTEWAIVKNENCFQFFPHRTKGEGFFIAAMKNLSRDAKFVKGKPDLNRLRREQRAILKDWFRPEVFEELEFLYKNDGNIVAIRTALLADYGSVLRALAKRSSGIEIGIFKGKDFVPSHAFALSDLIAHSIERLEVPAVEAMKFLRKENFEFSTGKDGWLLITYGGNAIGWVKKIGDRINNYLPAEWKIREDLV
ncbi:RNA methyltransferase [Lacihabitans sp. CCS-44]|uniref:methyltransferase RsmF C-terminal domain-like protein n=1 Tax=Lacihabitans sp. CCS-44 TaxID=2487331 RepID=UPI0020CC7343|nr:RNA methyltransferase [Lacihabitans sp. CCS-44]MCP9753753.1 RNA methyltransferase [Lacihabitans sp. CCS-44]